jgi:hypothetical protein
MENRLNVDFFVSDIPTQFWPGRDSSPKFLSSLTERVFRVFNLETAISTWKLAVQLSNNLNFSAQKQVGMKIHTEKLAASALSTMGLSGCWVANGFGLAPRLIADFSQHVS